MGTLTSPHVVRVHQKEAIFERTLVFWIIDLFNPICCTFFNMVWPCTCKGKFCFSHLTYCNCDVTFYSFCSLFVVMAMTWTDVCIWAHPKSLPRAFGRPLDSRWLFQFLLCYTVLTKGNQHETAVHGCRILLILGLVTFMSLSCLVSTQSDQPCRILSLMFHTL